MMTNTIKRLMREFEDAAIMKSWKGGRDPETWDDIDREYDRARDNLLNAVVRLRVACNEVIGGQSPATGNSVVVSLKSLEQMARCMNEVN